MIAEQVVEFFENDKTGAAAIGHGYTYSGHPVGAAAAVACLQETLRLEVNKNAAIRGAELHEGLLALQKKHALIGDVRGGHGLMCALELVADRETKKPIDKATIGKIQETAYRTGAMVRVSGPNIIMSPPLILEAADVKRILSALDEGFSAA